MRKKSSSIGRTTMVSSPSKKPASTLQDLHNKITSSSVLNGGFDTLLYKIDKIEQSQGQLVTKVDTIHSAIYHSDKGLFAKLSEQKLENEIKLNEINQGLIELSTWKQQREKIDQKEETILDKNKEKVHELEKSVEKLVESKDTAFSAVKWLAAAIGGAFVTLLIAYIKNKLNI